MCGRFTQRLSWEELHRLADLIGRPRNLGPRYNIAPTTPIEVIRPAETSGNELVQMPGGLCPDGGRSRSRSFLQRLMLVRRQSPRSRCSERHSRRDAVSFPLRAFTNGRAKRGRRRRTIFRRVPVNRSPSPHCGSKRSILTQASYLHRQLLLSARRTTG